MSNSDLVCHTHLSPNHSGKRTQQISKITPHHMSGNLSVETCGNVFAPASRKASSNYGIDSKGRVGLYVDEANRPWTSSSAYNDQRAVTIEVANSQCGGDWPVSAEAFNALVDLCVDIIKRNPGIKRADGRPGLHYTGDRTGSLTKHKMFSATDCPGTYLDQRMEELEKAVNAKLDGSPYVAPAKPSSGQQTSASKPSAKISPKVRSEWVGRLQAECNRQGFSNQKVDKYSGPITLKGCPVIKRGTKGPITRLLQEQFIALGFSCGSCGADGSCGPDTEKAIKAFQAANNLAVDGVCGPKTWSKILGLS